MLENLYSTYWNDTKLIATKVVQMHNGNLLFQRGKWNFTKCACFVIHSDEISKGVNLSKWLCSFRGKQMATVIYYLCVLLMKHLIALWI